MTPNGRVEFFGKVLLLGLIIGVTMGVVGRMLELPMAVIGGVTGALVAVAVAQMKKRV